MQTDKAQKAAMPSSTPGPGQIPSAPHIDADIAAIRELEDRIGQLWPGLTDGAREDLAACLTLLADAADRRATDSRAVREALQSVLLNIGTGSLTTLSESARQRLATLTGIALGVPGW